MGRRKSQVQKTCSYCGKPIKHRALCSTHDQQLRRGGALRPVKPRLGFTIDKKGYKMVRASGHPNADKSGRAMEHRLVMSNVLGRPLRNFENVHHKNGNRSDNRPENLELWITKQPRGQRPEDLVAWAKEILELYGSEFANHWPYPYIWLTNSTIPLEFEEIPTL